MPTNKLPVDETTNPKGWIPMKFQRALYSFLIADGISLYTNPVMWHYLDRIGFKYRGFIKAGLFGIIDVTLFQLTLWSITGRTLIHKLYCVAAALMLSFVMILHAGLVGEGEAEYKDTVTYAETTAKGLGEIAGAGAKGAAQGMGQAAADANARGQRNLTRRLANEAKTAGNASTNQAQTKFLETMNAKQTEQMNSWQGWYLRKAMMWALMSLALVLGVVAVFLSDDADNDGTPDVIQRWFKRVAQVPAQTQPAPQHQAPPPVTYASPTAYTGPVYTPATNGHNGHQNGRHTPGKI